MYFITPLTLTGLIYLRTSHNYYYQVQATMLCTQRKWCDFVVCTKNDIHIERIPYNEELMSSTLFTALACDLIKLPICCFCDGARGMHCLARGLWQEMSGGIGRVHGAAIAWPREWMVWIASSARPLSVSATMGRHSIPASWQAGRLEAELALYPR